MNRQVAPDPGPGTEPIDALFALAFPRHWRAVCEMLGSAAGRESLAQVATERLQRQGAARPRAVADWLAGQNGGNDAD